MKFTGYRKKGRHLPKNVSKKADQEAETDAENGVEKTASRFAWIKSLLSNKVLKKALLGLALVVGVAIVVLVMDVFAKTGIIIKAPDVNPVPRPGYRPPPANATGSSPLPEQTASPSGEDPDVEEEDNPRRPGTFTFLIFGIDSQANTDVIMTATFDTENYTFNVASIPRDTLTNVEWNVKKANQIVYNMRRIHRGEDNAEEAAMKGVKETFADILGYEVDYWVTVDLRGFAALIDAIGGVDFYIPQDMHYDDPAQNLHIHYSKGMKRGLTGQQSLEIIRFRMGYANKDIGRIETQQNFLKAAVDQILAKKSSINVATLADTFLKYVKTDLAINYVIWFGLEFLKLDAGMVSFVMMPGNSMDSVNGSSYVTIYVDEWLEIINERLNPFSDEVTPTDVSILTRGADRRLYVTDGNRQGDPAWGSSSRGPSPSGSSGSNSSSGGSGGNSSGNTGSTPAEPPGTEPDDIDGEDPAGGEAGPPDVDPGEGETSPDAPDQTSPDQTAPESPADPPAQPEPSPGGGEPGGDG